MNQKKTILKSVLLIGLGVGVGYYFMPAKTIEVEKVVTKDQVKTITVVKETTKPDGTVIKETKDIVDVKKTIDKEKSKIVEKSSPQWSVSLMGGKDTSWETTAGVMVQKRIVGPMSAGIYVLPMGSKMQAGGVFTYEF